jgi:chromosomal replication initiator protein
MNKRKDDLQQDQLLLGEDEQLTLLRRAWRNTLQELLPNVAQSSKGFLEQVVPINYREGCVLLQIDGGFAREWVNKRHKREIEELLSQYLGETIQVQIAAPNITPVSESAEHQAVVMIQTESSVPALPKPRLNSRYTFEQFVEGKSNRLAFAGAKAVVEALAIRYNPLFIYSTPGLGKTHLLHAIGQALLRVQPQARVMYFSAEEFLQSYVRSVREGKTEDFRAAHRSVHLWLVDDVQFLGGRDRTQEEFFHIFNVLYQSGRQIVLTSDRPPREIIALEERLRTRFEQGLCADIAAPDFELRLAILQAKAEMDGIPLPEEVGIFIADKVQSNIRALEGALTRLAAHASLNSEPIDLDMAAEILRSYFVEAKPAKVDASLVLSAVCEFFQVPKEELISKSRRGELAFIRQLAMYAVREMTGETWKRIAQVFGRDDHTTVMYAHQQISQKVGSDPDIKKKVQEIRRKIYSMNN